MLDVGIIKDEPIKLINLNIFSIKQLKILQEYNISSAEQFLGICATPQGFKGIMQALSITQLKLNQILLELKNQLSPELAELLSQPAEFAPPLGARKPRKKNKAK